MRALFEELRGNVAEMLPLEEAWVHEDEGKEEPGELDVHRAGSIGCDLHGEMQYARKGIQTAIWQKGLRVLDSKMLEMVGHVLCHGMAEANGIEGHTRVYGEERQGTGCPVGKRNLVANELLLPGEQSRWDALADAEATHLLRRHIVLENPQKPIVHIPGGGGGVRIEQERAGRDKQGQHEAGK